MRAAIVTQPKTSNPAPNSRIGLRQQQRERLSKWKIKIPSEAEKHYPFSLENSIPGSNIV
jgi:hypothetical protein